MRIGRAIIEGRPRILVSDGESWRDISDYRGSPAVPAPNIRKFIRSGRLTTAFLRSVAESAPEVPEPSYFELPLVPSKVVCLGRNYAEHARELGNEAPQEPVLFNKSPNTYAADGAEIRFDPCVGRVDYEGEIALVIGGKNDGLPAVAGYTLLNDVTARDLQSADKAKGLPWFRAKNLDTFCPIGPVIRLADTLPMPPDLDIELWVNGQIRQKGNTRQFLFDIPAMLDYISRYIGLSPGDLVGTGTPSGVGPLQDADRVEVRSREIGCLRSIVSARRPS